MTHPWNKSDDDEDDEFQFGEAGWPEDWSGPEYFLNKSTPPEKTDAEIVDDFLRNV